METVEKECGALGGLFQAIVNDMKCSYPVWEDFSAKATKLHSQLRATVLAAVAFLDAFQKVADMATNTRGKGQQSWCTEEGGIVGLWGRNFYCMWASMSLEEAVCVWGNRPFFQG
ncbi:hypothetical protein MATL_G00144840 [Megalops atlanticus]|uniref:IMD domain-containing protein n=1 Tax=Megalops atlanticus TaxID=7932 RepID=A0A9D3PWE2_MEGAT|nr:hypothetical protein MATL_G00144840 [Megalops atlanticus]